MANALTLTVVTCLGQFARTVITLRIFVVIACFFVGAASKRGSGGGRGGGRGRGKACGGGGGGSCSGGSGEANAWWCPAVRADRE